MEISNFFEKQSEFEYLDNCIRFSGHKLPRIVINMSYLFRFRPKSADIAVYWIFFKKMLNFEYFEKQSQSENFDNCIGLNRHKSPRIDINMPYLFHLSQKSANIAVFRIFLGKMKISDISKNRANSNILTIALDSVGINYLELI